MHCCITGLVLFACRFLPVPGAVAHSVDETSYEIGLPPLLRFGIVLWSMEK